MLHSPRLGPCSWVQGSLSGDPGPRQGLKLLVKDDKDFGYGLRVLQAGSLQLHPERSDLGLMKAHAQVAWFAQDRPLLNHLTLTSVLGRLRRMNSISYMGGGALRSIKGGALL